MAVSKTDYVNWHTLTGSLAEVAGALRDNKVGVTHVMGIGSHDGTAFWCVYKTL